MRSLTGASVRMSVLPGVMRARGRMAEKLRSNYQLAGQTREIRRAPADPRSRIQLRLPSASTVAQRGVDVRPRKPLDAANRCAPDLDAVMIAEWRRGMVARFKTGKHLKLSLC